MAYLSATLIGILTPPKLHAIGPFSHLSVQVFRILTPFDRYTVEPPELRPRRGRPLSGLLELHQGVYYNRCMQRPCKMCASTLCRGGCFYICSIMLLLCNLNLVHHELLRVLPPANRPDGPATLSHITTAASQSPGRRSRGGSPQWQAGTPLALAGRWDRCYTPRYAYLPCPCRMATPWSRAGTRTDAAHTRAQPEQK